MESHAGKVEISRSAVSTAWSDMDGEVLPICRCSDELDGQNARPVWHFSARTLVSPRGKRLEIIPCGKLLNSFCTDYLVAVSEIAEGGRLVVLYELKKTVAHHLVSVDENYLAEAVVEAYYALLGGEVDLPSIVVWLTDVGTTHYFRLRFPVTRSSSYSPPPPPPRKLELLWYERICLEIFPPKAKEDLFQFIDHFHFVLDQVL